MNGRDKRKKRAQQARYTRPVARGIKDPWGGLCPNGCGEPGPHFVPPSLGDPGFYTCESRPIDMRMPADQPCDRCAFIPTPDGKCICREVAHVDGD